MGTKLSVTDLTDVGGKASQICLRKYVAAVYKTDQYIRCIIAHNGEECDIIVKFMERKGHDIFVIFTAT